MEKRINNGIPNTNSLGDDEFELEYNYNSIQNCFEVCRRDYSIEKRKMLNIVKVE
jgi:hypothetical protein